MFKGVTSDGINTEVSSILECARLNQNKKIQSLAIPERGLITLAHHHMGMLEKDNKVWENCSVKEAYFAPGFPCPYPKRLPRPKKK